MIRTRKGYTLVELVLVMFLLVLVASLVFSLTAAGSRAWLRLTAASDARSNIRTAVSYIEVKLKQSDEVSAIAIEADPFFGRPALKLSSEIKNPTIPGLDTSITWIYLHEGMLYELVTLPDMQVSPSSGRPLVQADAWELEVLSDNLLRINLILLADMDSSSDSLKQKRQFEAARNIFIRSGGLQE